MTSLHNAIAQPAFMKLLKSRKGQDELFELLKTQIVNQKMIESSAIENRLGVSIDDALLLISSF